MKKFLVVLTVLAAGFMVAQAYAQMGMMGGRGMGNMSMIRHRYVMQNGIPAQYASKRNPVPATAANLEAGKKLYLASCAICHGATGLGNGESAKTLNPPPTNIAAFSKMPMASDGYLYWTIAEGGVPMRTSMPAYKSYLKEKQIWLIITYLRQL